MTLTVRLDNALESALARHCEQRGVTKSLVVQESLAAYLLAAAPTGPLVTAQPPAAYSANFRALTDSGLVGAVALGQGADKAAVRARVQGRRAKRKP